MCLLEIDYNGMGEESETVQEGKNFIRSKRSGDSKLRILYGGRVTWYLFVVAIFLG